MTDHLYRGVSVELDSKLFGKLIPKQQGKFLYEFTADETGVTCDYSKVTIGSSIVNAVHRHQLLQKGYPTSGISTTPKFDRAKMYAKGIQGNEEGYVYKLNRSLLASLGVKEHVVSEFVTHPAVPEDEEVILCSDEGVEIPSQIIIEKIKV